MEQLLSISGVTGLRRKLAKHNTDVGYVHVCIMCMIQFVNIVNLIN